MSGLEENFDMPICPSCKQTIEWIFDNRLWVMPLEESERRRCKYQVVTEEGFTLFDGIPYLGNARCYPCGYNSKRGDNIWTLLQLFVEQKYKDGLYYNSFQEYIEDKNVNWSVF